MLTEKWAEAGLKAASLTSYVTPRRLALIIQGLHLQTEAVTEERKGPRADAPAQALEGVLRPTGLTRDKRVDRADRTGNRILFAGRANPGRTTNEETGKYVPTQLRAYL